MFSIPGEHDPVDRPVREPDPELIAKPPLVPVYDEEIEEFLNRVDDNPEPIPPPSGKVNAFAKWMKRERQWYEARLRALRN